LINANTPENEQCPLIKDNYNKDDKILSTLLKLIMIRILRPDRFPIGLELIKNIISKELFEMKENII